MRCALAGLLLSLALAGAAVAATTQFDPNCPACWNCSAG